MAEAGNVGQAIYWTYSGAGCFSLNCYTNLGRVGRGCKLTLIVFYYVNQWRNVVNDLIYSNLRYYFE
jgi:hypothetical protein